MISQERDDLVWDVLTLTANKVAPELPAELLEKVYEIQKRHQFSHDSSESLQLMEKLIDGEVGSGE